MSWSRECVFVFTVIFIFIWTKLCEAAEPEYKILPTEGADHSTDGSAEAPHSTASSHGGTNGQFPIVTVQFDRVSTPFIISLWIFCASVAKIGFHMTPKLSNVFPESCLLIVVGVIVGIILYFSHSAVSPLTPNSFFFYMLPPIILDAGYFMPNRLFFDHLGTILLMAVVGTVLNTMSVGCALYLCGINGLYQDMSSESIDIMQLLLFAALISAVDPVAVLAVFEEVHVNEVLYIVVFGESLLNDAVTVVLYHMFEAFVELENEGYGVSVVNAFSGFGSFFVVALGGIFFGVAWGLLTGFVTRFTNHVRVIEPIFVFVMAYMSYMNAEIFHMSGILAITFCGVTMKNYVLANVSPNSQTTIKYTMKMISNASETIIFMFLGVETVRGDHEWDTAFVCLTIFFCTFFRCLYVIILTFVANKFRIKKLEPVEQFVMAYGGLRGAVAFALAVSIDDHVLHGPIKKKFVTTTIAVIYFTVFVQGITIKPLVQWLGVKRAQSKEKSLNERIHEKAIDHLMACIEMIVGNKGDFFVRDRFKFYEQKFIRPIIVREKKSLEPKIIETFSQVRITDAMEYMEGKGPLVSASSGNLKMSNSGGSALNLDLHEMEYNPCHRDITQASMNHLLDLSLNAKPKHRLYKRHTVRDMDLNTQWAHHAPVPVRRMMSIDPRLANNKLSPNMNGDTKDDKRDRKISKFGQKQIGSDVVLSHDRITGILNEKIKLSPQSSPRQPNDDDGGIFFDAHGKLVSSPAGKRSYRNLGFQDDEAVLSPSHIVGYKKDSDDSRKNSATGSDGDSEDGNTPALTETALPWRRDDEADVCYFPTKQKEFPPWCSNKEFFQYSSPTNTFLGSLDKEKKRPGLFNIFQRSDSRVSAQGELRRESLDFPMRRPSYDLTKRGSIDGGHLGVHHRRGSSDAHNAHKKRNSMDCGKLRHSSLEQDRHKLHGDFKKRASSDSMEVSPRDIIPSVIIEQVNEIDEDKARSSSNESVDKQDLQPE